MQQAHVHTHVCVSTHLVLETNTDTGTLSACFKSSIFGEIIPLPEDMTVKISINIMYKNE
jgi:hypothetical protein